MNKITYITLLSSILLLGCNKDAQKIESNTFTATIEENTKTSLDIDGNVFWKKGDQVGIFAETTVNKQYQVSDDSDGKKKAKFILVSGSGSGAAINNNVSFYPYQSELAISMDKSGYIISGITLPSFQNYMQNSFGNGSFPMVAVSKDTDFSFKNILGGVKLQLKGTATIKSISVKGNNNEILCGAAEVTASNVNIPSISLSDESAKTVTLDCGEGIALNTETATSFIIAIPPMTMSAGFTVTIIDTDEGQMEHKTTKSQVITRSSILKMSEITYSPKPKMEAVDLGLSVKWARCNIGATIPQEWGSYFAWGDVVGQTYDSWSSSWSGGGFSIDPDYQVDDNNNLKPEYDAAHVILGGKWRMPTQAELQELIDNCNIKWTTVNGVYGRRFTSRKTGYTDKYIFLPATGYGISDIRRYGGSQGHYWSSTLYGGISRGLYFDSDCVNTDYGTRNTGKSVRPVTE